MPRHHVFMIPGMFGFGELAGYDYFTHFEEALARRFARVELPLSMYIVPAPPTASLAIRAGVLARHMAMCVEDESDPVHLLGHSTGGLDSRLLVSPGGSLGLTPRERRAVHQVRTVVTINTPHHGTPLAGYFTSVAGTRLLYALSLLTVTSLSLGKLPLTAFSGLVAGLAAVDDRLGMDIKLLDELTDQVLRFVGDQGRTEILEYLEHVRHDRGGIIHLMPEVMELFNATVADNPEVRYGCVASAAPPPGPRRLLRGLRSPYAAMSLALYSTVYGVASRADNRYPYAQPDRQQQQVLTEALGVNVRPETVDGIVPTLSMLWRELLWCGRADHLDVVGHFEDGGVPVQHVDWLQSGAHFGRSDFAAMVDAIAAFLQRSP